jgi:hypothetical protein
MINDQTSASNPMIAAKAASGGAPAAAQQA